MALKKWAVVYKDTGQVSKMFEERAQANHYITDVFGPEWNTVFVMDIQRKIK